MADNITLKRIVDLVAQTDVDETVYTIIDSVAGTVKKYPIGSLICSIAPIFDTTAAYAAGKYCNYNGQLYRFDEAHAAGSWTGSDATAVTLSEFLEEIGPDVDDLKEALDAVETTLTHKADKDGTVASAEQLLSDVGTEDKVPYLFRATPYDSTRVDEEVVGCSVGYNQLVSSGKIVATKTVSDVTFTNNSDGSITINGTASANIGGISSGEALTDNITIPRRNHKVFISLGAPVPETMKIGVSGYAIADYSPYFFVKADTADWTSKLCCYITSGTVFNNLKIYPQIIDLTAWFGSTIADYAYTLEQATAGSGVAFIKALLPGGYIPYSAPKMESVSGLSGHKFTGFNWWDEEYENGYYDTSDGSAKASSSWARSKNPIKCIPNTVYCMSQRVQGASLGYVLFYDADGNYINTYVQMNSALYVGSGQTFTTPANAWQMKFYSGGANFALDLCINLSDPARNGQYEPYKETTYALDSDLTLRGILKMDADHNVYADGDVYGSDGTVTRKYGTRAYQEGDESLENAITDGTNTVYKLTTSTTEEADPYTSPQNCAVGGTEEYVYGESGSGVPVGHNSKYLKNMRSELERVSDAVPVAPEQNGTYSLKATVTSSGVTYGWVAE